MAYFDNCEKHNSPVCEPCAVEKAVYPLNLQIDRLRAENEALQSNYYRLCLWAIDRRPDLPDHSCAKCVPNSELLIPEYLCAYHTAKTWAAQFIHCTQ